jgi:hypothetical protein
MQSIKAAVNAFMRPISPYPFHKIGANYNESYYGEMPDWNMSSMLTSNDPFQFVQTLTIAQALTEIRAMAPLQFGY